jgi:hypothetical protein
MNPLLALLVIILAFGVVGRIDYECAQMSAHSNHLREEITMQATKFCEFGPGDAATWPPCMGHPHDPRAPIDDEDPRSMSSTTFAASWPSPKWPQKKATSERPVMR